MTILAPIHSPHPALTALCHGGGCGCKIAPSVLSSLLANSPFERIVPPALMVGTETADDAAVYQLNDSQALILTTDFFLPVVDDPTDFGRIAATNAISDVFAMGGTPILALAIVGMPIDKLPTATIRAILQGGESVCVKAGIPLAGGHSIDSAEPFYGLVVAGLAHPKRIRKNATAKAGDVLILMKPLGVGIYSAALRKKMLNTDDYNTLINTTTQLNTIGTWLGTQESVHALTDVTGFGLPGHLLEICKGSNLSATLYWEQLPWLPRAMEFAKAGYITGASKRNWQSYGNQLHFSRPLTDYQQGLLTDPQTSGGLLASVDKSAVVSLCEEAIRQGFQPTIVGKMEVVDENNRHLYPSPNGIFVHCDTNINL